MEDYRFDGRVAVITGAGGNPGLGRSYALLLASRGAKVLVNDYGIGPDGRGAIGGGPDDVVREIVDAGGEALSNRDSVATRDGAEGIIRAATDAWGHVDILINNAGIAPFALFQEFADNDVQRVVDSHLMGTIWMCRAAWLSMAERQYGRIVNVTSTVGLINMHQSVYSGAKMGILGLTRSIALEGRSLGIKANAISPMADTLAWRTMLTPEFSEQAKRQGLVPDAVAPIVAWLAHERCHVTGGAWGAGAGSIYEVFVSRTAGTQPDADLTIEKVGGRIEAASDRAGATEYAMPPEDTSRLYTAKPYDPTPRADNEVRAAVPSQ